MSKPFCASISATLARAQANADATGARWVVFFDTSGRVRAERYDPTCRIHNFPGTSHLHPRKSARHTDHD